MIRYLIHCRTDPRTLGSHSMHSLTSLILIVAVGACHVVRAADPPVPAGKQLNPEYASWCRFPKGNSTTLKTVGKGCEHISKSPSKWTTVETMTLLDVSPDKLEIEMQRTKKEDDGIEVKSKPWTVSHAKYFDLRPGAKPQAKPDGWVHDGEKAMTILGKSYPAKYSKIEQGHFDAEGSTYTIYTWTNDEIPGGVFRIDRDQTGTDWFSSITELTAFTKPTK